MSSDLDKLDAFKDWYDANYRSRTLSRSPYSLMSRRKQSEWTCSQLLLALRSYAEAQATLQQLANVNQHEAPEFFRASGDALCAVCGKSYREHPSDRTILYDGCPFLTVLCDETRVKQ